MRREAQLVADKSPNEDPRKSQMRAQARENLKEMAQQPQEGQAMATGLEKEQREPEKREAKKREPETEKASSAEHHDDTAPATQ